MTIQNITTNSNPISKPTNNTFLDLEGQQFGNLTVSSFAGIRDRSSFWNCVCKCGGVTTTRTHSLRCGATTSCGKCKLNELIKKFRFALKEDESICLVPECNQIKSYLNLCSSHYQKLKRNGTYKRENLTPEDKFWKCVKKDSNPNGCWVWTGTKDQRGYGLFRLGRKYRQKAHRQSWFLKHGEMPTLNVLHKCDNPSCVNPSHLELGTHQENMRQAVERNRFGRGEQCSWARLSEDDVKEIKSLFQANENKRKIAKQFNVSLSAIWHIYYGKTWKHI